MSTEANLCWLQLNSLSKELKTKSNSCLSRMENLRDTSSMRSKKNKNKWRPWAIKFFQTVPCPMGRRIVSNLRLRNVKKRNSPRKRAIRQREMQLLRRRGPKVQSNLKTFSIRFKRWSMLAGGCQTRPLQHILASQLSILMAMAIPIPLLEELFMGNIWRLTTLILKVETITQSSSKCSAQQLSPQQHMTPR